MKKRELQCGLTQIVIFLISDNIINKQSNDNNYQSIVKKAIIVDDNVSENGHISLLNFGIDSQDGRLITLASGLGDIQIAKYFEVYAGLNVLTHFGEKGVRTQPKIV
ncbi:hypothetical protein NI382_17220 [Vibrio parahaemolyticus]|nr:hypothetical protein NI382_17220 [Vibrio parahaemolyticus]